MPAFTFEKIAPPARRGSHSSSPNAPGSPAANSHTANSHTVNSRSDNPYTVPTHRSFIFQIIDRFVEVRIKRTLRS